MAHAESEITIRRSPQDVYAFLADGLHNPQWRRGVSVDCLDRWNSRGLGRRLQPDSYRTGRAADRWRLHDHRRRPPPTPGKRLGFQVIAGPARPTGEYQLTEAATGTVVRFTLDLQPKGLMKLVEPVIKRTMRAEVDQLDNLKNILETP